MEAFRCWFTIRATTGGRILAVLMFAGNAPAQLTTPIQMDSHQHDESLAAGLPAILRHHQIMLADGFRNRALHRALKARITPRTRLLDVGAGTGTWAIVAARLGAREVVAVETEECLIPIIQRHAIENGVADKIEIIHANVNDLRFRRKFDVIVAELFGRDAIGAETVRSLVRVRKRFLAENGSMIPQKLSLLAAPARFAAPLDDVPKGLPISAEFLKELRRNYGLELSLSERQGLALAARPKPLIELDFRTISGAAAMKELCANWRLRDLGAVNSIVTFNRLGLTEKISMNTLDSASWGVALYEFASLPAGAGRLSFCITFDDQRTTWSIGVPTRAASAQVYGPVFAFTRLRMAQLTSTQPTAISPR
jgi:SAM-dependent methyltransferase